MISVLLIDDDPDMLDLTSLEIGDEGDLAIQTCNSPDCAIGLAQEHRFDSIVCDFYMPGMDGCSLLELLRCRGCTAQLILFTGKEPDDLITHALDRCVDYYIQRQGNPEAEFRELKKIIRKSSAKKKLRPQ